MKNRPTVILIVDDDANDRYLIEAAFRQTGVEASIHAVNDGEQAIQYLQGDGPFADRTKYEFPTLMLVDLKMPKVNGFELLRFLQTHPDLTVIPTIVFTSSADRNDVTNAYLLGANSYQVKGQTLADLRRQLKTLYDYWMECEVPEVDKSGKVMPTEGSGKLSENVPLRNAA